MRITALTQMFERADMRIRQIGDMNVVTNCRAVRRRIIAAKHRHVRLLTRGCLQNDGNQMRLRIVMLTATLRRACGIEIPQRRKF